MVRPLNEARPALLVVATALLTSPDPEETVAVTRTFPCGAGLPFWSVI
jgi:hypothetical protein